MEQAKRDSVSSVIGDYCILSKEEDFMEVTEWTNGEGFDIHIDAAGLDRMMITYGQFKLLKKLVKQLKKVK